MKRYRIVNMKRFRLFILFLVALSLAISMFLATNTRTFAKGSDAHKLVVVKRGDTVWSIALEHIQDQPIDINEYIFSIVKLNNIKNTYLQPGDSLVIPTL